MAFGIFAIGTLPRLPGGQFLRAPVSWALLAGWAMLALAYARHYRRMRLDAEGPVECFAFGTWVAGTAVVAGLMHRSAGLRYGAVVLGAAAFVLWMAFLPAFARAGLRLASQQRSKSISGVVLLWTVSTQSVALVAADLLPRETLSRGLIRGLLAFGAGLYVAMVTVMLRSLARAPAFTLAEDWANTNCILHGALSITGLAAVVSGDVPISMAVALWMVTAILFFVVEGIELARLRARVRAYGWRSGLLVYDVSQWARNFTFGMFYAFTMSLASRPEAAAAAPLRPYVGACGSYVVLALLVAETAILCVDRWPSRDRGSG